MSTLSNLLGLLQQYKTADPASPPANAQQDFHQVSQQAPQENLASGLAEAFRSNQTPPFGQMLANLFGQSSAEQRAGILNKLLAAGPALSGGIGGELAGLLNGGANVTPEQAQQVHPDTVRELADHAQKSSPSIIDEVSDFYSQHPRVVEGLGAGALALIMSHVSKRV